MHKKWTKNKILCPKQREKRVRQRKRKRKREPEKKESGQTEGGTATLGLFVCRTQQFHVRAGELGLQGVTGWSGVKNLRSIL